jgi:Arc/MetJ-type ribon-helix-helix transcriptional regulator
MARNAKSGTVNVDQVMSLRLDGRRRRGIARVARARHTSPSEVVRSAVDALLERAEGSSQPYEAWVRVIGKARGLSADLSERTGARFAETLRRRR